MQQHWPLRLTDAEAGGDGSAGAATDGGPVLGHLVGVALRDNPRRAQLLVSTVLGKHIPTDPRLVLGAGRLLGARVAAALGRGPDPDLAAAADLIRAALAGSAAGQAAGSAVASHDDTGARNGAGADGEPTPSEAAAALLAAGTEAGSDVAGQGVLVLGFAETATGLGHAVADALPACRYLHSTRREVPGVAAAAAFEEEHSHATAHRLLTEDPGLLTAAHTVVLVDDELSTGRTARNTLRALHSRAAGNRRYVIAALVDLRGAGDRAALEALAGELDAPIEVVALAAGTVELPTEPAPVLPLPAATLPADVAGLGPGGDAVELPTEPAPVPPLPVAAGPVRAADDGAGSAVAGADVVDVDLRWPRGLREGGRHGWSAADSAVLERQLSGLAARLAVDLQGPRVLVLGTEELMYLPVRLAAELAATTAYDVRYSCTTRSPAGVLDDPGYPLRTGLRFASPEDGGPRFAYNVLPTAGGPRWDTVVVVTDEDPGPLVAALRGAADRVVVAAVPAYRPAPLPEPLRGPAFGSYAGDEVGWLLQDLSAVALEAPTEEREEAIQAGRGHYAESLPIEYEPSPAYRRLYAEALTTSARRVAEAVAVVGERILAGRPAPVLVSLARAGTPIGILIRRWAAYRHDLDLPHYALSIVRGRGVDAVALRWLAERHDPGAVVFVDGWTGKGAIVRELAAALAEHAAGTGVVFDPELAVLADPGQCVRCYGTRDDFLIPSACLNSTVSGLVSRTVLNDELIAPGEFHGAKFYADLAPVDVSRAFLDAVAGHFPDLGPVPVLPPVDTAAPSWAGWAAVEKISVEYDVGHVNLVKPGVGETTRVLLRRVPWRILLRPGAEAEVAHVLQLAAERNVPVETVAGLPYSCVGLIRPSGRG